MFFFFKQKTAYEMRISDWSSDVCSSDLLTQISAAFGEVHAAIAYLVSVFPELSEWKSVIDRLIGFQARLDNVEVTSQVRHEQQASGQIGRASCRERVCQYV